MKLFSSIVFAAVFTVLAGWAAPSQTKPSGTSSSDVKEVQTTLPSSEPMRMRAISIDRNWDASTTHLKGDVEITIRVSEKDGERHNLVIHADEANVNEKSGEITPSGHVRIMVEEAK